MGADTANFQSLMAKQKELVSNAVDRSLTELNSAEVQATVGDGAAGNAYEQFRQTLSQVGTHFACLFS